MGHEWTYYCSIIFPSWWLIPRIVSGWNNPGNKWDFCGGNVHKHNWGEVTHLNDSWVVHHQDYPNNPWKVPSSHSRSLALALGEVQLPGLWDQGSALRLRQSLDGTVKSKGAFFVEENQRKTMGKWWTIMGKTRGKWGKTIGKKNGKPEENHGKRHGKVVILRRQKWWFFT